MRVLLVGIGGASCSGKTLLGKHLAGLLPNALLLHQDDFAPKEENVPVNPVHGVQDWDDPPTCMDWPRFRSTLRYTKEHGELPEGYESFDHLNKQVEVGVPAEVLDECTAWLRNVEKQSSDEILWVLVDGFVLYWDKEIYDALDVRLLIRVPKATLQHRRESRAVYILQNAEDAAAGGIWKDPPNYFPNIVWPAYVKAHEHLFASGDVENGECTAEGVALIEPGEGRDGMGAALRTSVGELVRAVKSGRGCIVDQSE